MSKRIGVFTIASKNYLAYVRVLLKSVAKVHPEYELYLCLADRVDGYFDAVSEPFTVVQADAIGIPTLDDMAIRYDIMEFNTAVKPYMFQWLLQNKELDSVIYLDPDIRVYSRLTAIEQQLATGGTVVLTPHITRPVEDGKNPNDYHMLQAGVFNLGFAAVRRCPEGVAFVEWWGRRLATMGVADFSKNLFTDQRWCDLAPCFLNDLRILKNPAYNVAYWNLAERHITFDGKYWSSNGQPLAFFHFSGVNASKSEMVSKHQDRFDWTNLPLCRPLFDQYRESLVAEGWSQTSQWPYAYATVEGEFAVAPIIRRLYRETFTQPQFFAPANARDFLVELCNAPSLSTAQLSEGYVSELMGLVYRLRPDLQATFSLGTHEGRQQFAEWFAAAAATEYGLPAAVVPKASARKVALRHAPAENESLRDTQVHGEASKSPIPNVSLDATAQALSRLWRALPDSLKPTAAPLFKHWIQDAGPGAGPTPVEGQSSHVAKIGEVERIDFLDEAAAIKRLVPDHKITNLMHMIWRSRPDLQQVFNLASAEGQSSFVSWFTASAAREYGIQLREEEAESRGSPTGASAAYRHGANLVGYAHAELGMGEHVRMTAAALSQTTVPYSVVNFNVGVASRQGASLDHGELVAENKHAANLFHINADQMLTAYCRLGRSFFSGRYNIGYWAWELAKCPDDWFPVLSMIDEVWAPSRFIQAAFAEKADIPVEYMPLCVTLPALQPYSRRHFGLPEQTFLFLYTFDFFSYLDRKNPFAAILAFKAGFSRNDIVTSSPS